MKILSMSAIARLLIFACVMLSHSYLLASPTGPSEKAGPEETRAKNRPIELWLTTPDKTNLFERQKDKLQFSPLKGRNQKDNHIQIDKDRSFQTMDGFGFSLTGGSALNIYRMERSHRHTLLNELFRTTGKSIGVSYLRISIGASDLDEKPFSYNDLPAGETDPELKKFSLAPDRKYLIPLLKEILAINPHIKILGSPWSPPAWMKTNNHSKGGSLKPEYYPVYAQYFVKYIEGMKAEGIRIDAITVQNEPLHPGNNPSLLMLPEAQAEFVKNHLGPAFKRAALKTKIIIYDHNADRPDYPISVLNDPQAKQYIDGSAFHLYGGTIDALSKVHEAHPDKDLYFTEQWIGAPGKFAEDLKWHVRELLVGATRNWCKTVLEWNLAADSQQKPYTEGGCDECLGAVTIEGNQITRNPAYYIIAHASKFVRPGSVRIQSSLPAELPNVAFKTPEGKIVLIVLNNSNIDRKFSIGYKENEAAASLRAGAVATFVW